MPPVGLVRILAAALLGALAACGAAESERERLTVFAAASLTAAFEGLETAFEARHPDLDLVLHVAGTPRLVLQIREGAPVDVFAAADRPNMDRVVDGGRVLEGPIDFATNRLAIATAPGNPAGIAGLSDLARADLAVVLCGPEVPAGRYARQALASAGVVVASRSDEPSVDAVLQRVGLGEVDAGIVYATDILRADGRVAGVALPPEHDVVARYPVAVLDGPATEEARRFVAFLTSAEGLAILSRFGFGPP